MDTQYTDGITGALIIHPVFASPNTTTSIPGAPTTLAPPADFPTWEQGSELVVQMADLYHTFSAELAAGYLSVRAAYRLSSFGLRGVFVFSWLCFFRLPSFVFCSM